MFSIQALGDIPHEESLPTLIAIMKAYRVLENQIPAHGDSGNEEWSRFYIPARTSFNKITSAGAESTALAERWMKENPEFKVRCEERIDPNAPPEKDEGD